MSKILPPTEMSAKLEKTIDKLNFQDGIDLIIQSQKEAINAVKKVNIELELIISEIINHISKVNTSRIVYVGAGTSGRIGVQDGAELNPTFGWPLDRVKFIIAGGKKSLMESIENAEDDTFSGNEQVDKLSIGPDDVVIALAASGNTPFTNSALNRAKKMGALCVAIVNNPKGSILNMSDYNLILNTGPEIITGSTRLKAGTAQKICLNIISSLVMTHLGRVKDGEMIFLKPNNNKLKERQKRIKENTKYNN